MALTFRKLHPCFAAEVGPVDLKTVHDEATLGRIRAGMDEFAVLVFRDQIWSDAEHLDFAQRLAGSTPSSASARSRRTAWATRRSGTSRTSTRAARS